ncbi:MAG TPA: YihY/virulence factor BrkB family protein [Actinomycetota bacterium]
MSSVARRVDAFMGRIEKVLPSWIGEEIHDLRGRDLFLHAAALAFYALISIAPLVVVVMWIVGIVLGDERVQELGREAKRLAPSNLGIDQALQRVTTRGVGLGLPAALTAIWPASAYGAGLTRAFDSLSEGSRMAPGLWGRVLAVLVLLPLLSIGAVVAAYLGTTVFGTEGWSRVFGLGVGLISGFVAMWLATALIYAIVPPRRPPWGGIVIGASITAVGSALLALGFVFYLSSGADFEERYATSALAGMVLLGLWLYFSHALMLLGYRTTRDG